jgi:hypothetical protein
MTLDEPFYTEHGPTLHNNNFQDSSACTSLFTSSPTFTYLDHASTTVRLSSPSGPHTKFNVFGSPYSPKCGSWGFSYLSPRRDPDTTEFTKLWDAIPLDADIVVTHTPPRMHCDQAEDGRPLGCEALRRALWRVRPSLAVCGHVHQGRGVQRVKWNLLDNGTDCSEEGVEDWVDPGKGNNKESLVDLTGKKTRVIDNDGSYPLVEKNYNDQESSCVADRKSYRPGLANTEGLLGRLGRKETCVINCAIMGNSYPHVGGKKLNKPIVVDLLLPVWEE